MKKVVIVAASVFGLAGAAVAADLPVRQPPPAAATGAPIIGKAPIGKAPIGKFPIGKGPVIAPAPAPAPGPVVTRG